MNYIPHNENDIQEMLKSIGVKNVNELFNDIPDSIRIHGNLQLSEGMDEISITDKIEEIAGKNKQGKIFLGAGSYHHYVPPLVDYVVSRGEFLTAYTPYQPEISQGTLRVIYDYQSMITILTGMDVANASMYDGATATAEAMLMACNMSGAEKKALVSDTIHPDYLAVLKTYAEVNNIEITLLKRKGLETDIEALEKLPSAGFSAFIIQSPNFFGSIENLSKIGKILSDKKILFVCCVAEAMSLALLQPPGAFGAEITAGEAQSFGSRMNFGGPYLGFFAAKNQHVRRMPGRLVGKTTDKDGKTGYVLTLSTREQHIRRDKATSNICSNHNLCAVSACVYLALMGKRLKDVASLCFDRAHYLADEIAKINGMSVENTSPFFNEFVVSCKNAEKVKQMLDENDFIAGYLLESQFPEMKNKLLFCATEMNSIKDIDSLVQILKKA